MGYILPIQPIQSQIYANRLNMEPYNFAYIERVNRVKLNSDFLDEFKESLHQEREKEEEEGKPIVSDSFDHYQRIYLSESSQSITSDSTK